MGIFGQNTGKTITKREQCTSKEAIYRGNPHFQPFFNHRTRPPQIHQLRTVFTPTHTITHRYTPLHTHRSPHTRTPHRCTHDISAQLLDLHGSFLQIYVVTYAIY